MLNSNTHEISLCYYDEDLRKWVVHSTLFDPVSNSNQDLSIFDAYGHLFVDNFNKLISQFKWPFRRNQ